MCSKDLDIVLEIEKKSVNHENEMFYRYRVGDFKLWFAQDQENGNIYSVGFVEDGDNLKDFDLRISANEEGRDGYFPNQFEIRPRSYGMVTGDAREFMGKMEQACAVLDTVEKFFQTSKHRELFEKGHGIVKDHKEWLSFEESAVLVEKGQDDMISRENLMSEIVSFFAREGRGFGSLDDDCKKVWLIIDNYDSQAGDLISREGLLNAVLDEFGCDLAYYGKDLQFFQDAIVGVPAVSEGSLDALITDAERKCSGMNKDNGKRDFAEIERETSFV